MDCLENDLNYGTKYFEFDSSSTVTMAGCFLFCLYGWFETVLLVLCFQTQSVRELVTSSILGRQSTSQDNSGFSVLVAEQTDPQKCMSKKSSWTGKALVSF